jgi:hypothetical protein
MQLSQTYILDRRAALTGHSFPRVSDFGEKKIVFGKTSLYPTVQRDAG